MTQPRVRSPTDEGPIHADFVKQGVIFGYRAGGDYATKGIYNFGRSTQACMLELRRKDGEDDGEWIRRQKDMLKTKMRRTGLNAPSQMLLWVRVSDVETYWDEFKRQLGGWGGRLQTKATIENLALVPIDGKEPLVTQQLDVGDQFYTVENMGVSDFGTWCNALISKLLAQDGL
jgi:hypothetical protein